MSDNLDLSPEGMDELVDKQDKWIKQYIVTQKIRPVSWDIERAFEVALGAPVTENETYEFGGGRVKYARIAAEDFVRDFIHNCDCQPREREA